MSELLANATKLTLCVCMIVLTVACAFGSVSADNLVKIIGAAVAIHMGTSAVSGFSNGKKG